MVQVHNPVTRSSPFTQVFFVNSQGKTKGLQTKSASSRHAAKAAANMKKGQRHIAPKKAVLVKQAMVKKVSLSQTLFLSSRLFT
jgi:hypothetical protein